MCSDFMLTNFVFYFCIYCIESPLNTQMLRDERRALGMNYHNGAKYFLKSHLNCLFLKSLNSQVLATVEAAVASQQPGSRPRLERTLKDAEHDFRFLSSSVVHSPNIYILAGIC